MALGAEVQLLAKTDIKQKHSDIWSRDPVVIFPDKKKILCTTSGDEGRAIIQQNIYTEINRRDSDYEVIETDAYFEGGNVFYLRGNKENNMLLLHGNNAEGHYKMSQESYEHQPNIQTEKLSNSLKDLNIKVLGIDLSSRVLLKQLFVAYNAYHLDCFMQAMPDGRLLVLNKEIISETSWNNLSNELGEKLVDLKYDDYLSCPVKLNFVTIPTKDTFYVVSGNLPSALFMKLQELGYIPITRELFLPSSVFFHEGLNDALMKNMRAIGFQGNFPAMSLLSENDRPEELVKLLLSSNIYDDPFDVDGHGGLHCLTLDVPNLGVVSPDSVFEVVLTETEKKQQLPIPNNLISIVSRHESDFEVKMKLLFASLRCYSSKEEKIQLVDELIKLILEHQRNKPDYYDYEAVSEHFSVVKDLFPECRDIFDITLKNHSREIAIDDVFYAKKTPIELREIISANNISLKDLLDSANHADNIEKLVRLFINSVQDLHIFNEIQQYVQVNLDKLISYQHDKKRLQLLFPTLNEQIEAFEIKAVKIGAGTAQEDYSSMLEEILSEVPRYTISDRFPTPTSPKNSFFSETSGDDSSQDISPSP